MSNGNWRKITDIYLQLLEVPESDRAAHLDRLALAEEEKTALSRLLVANTQDADFFATGGAIEHHLQFLNAGETVGSWRILEMIGAGGMGEVYRVERADGHYSQIAALKRITLSDETAFERFERERQILARLEHPNIGRLIDGGVDDKGAPYFVMELIEGQTLLDYAKGRRLNREQVLQLFLKVCSALSHAHGRFVLHRDLKPTNIMVNTSGEVKVIDFGVAGLVEQGDQDLRAPMTLQYAAPEQLEGREASVQTDIFSLGLTLSELLTADPPAALASGNRVRLDGLPADLAAILKKATDPDVSERYESVDALASDIRNFRTHRPVIARHPSALYKGVLFMRRNVMAVGLVCVLCAGFVGVSWQYVKAERERDVALHERERLRTMQAATFLMFSEAGSSGGDKTAGSLILKAAEQAKADFEADPEKAAPVLQMFGEMLFLINDYTSAEPLLQSVSDLPVKPGNEDIVARASHDLANVYLRSGKVEQAGGALERALGIWKSDAAQFHDQILGAVLIESQLMAETGDLTQAEALLSESLPRRIAFSGETSLETAILLTNIGVARMRLGNIEGALGSSERARDVFSAIERLDTPDGLNAMNNLATLYHISGRLEEAEAAYLATLDIRQKLYGPSTALAVLMSNYGKLKLQQAKTSEAALLLSNAVEMADEFSGTSSPAAFAARFGLIEALASSEQIGEAESVLTEVSINLKDAGLTSGPYVGLFHVARAQVAAAKGEPSAAIASLDAADQIFAEMGVPAARYAAKVQQVRASLDQELAGTPL